MRRIVCAARASERLHSKLDLFLNVDKVQCRPTFYLSELPGLVVDACHSPLTPKNLCRVFKSRYATTHSLLLFPPDELAHLVDDGLHDALDLDVPDSFAQEPLKLVMRESHTGTTTLSLKVFRESLVDVLGSDKHAENFLCFEREVVRKLKQSPLLLREYVAIQHRMHRAEVCALGEDLRRLSTFLKAWHKCAHVVVGTGATP